MENPLNIFKHVADPVVALGEFVDKKIDAAKDSIVQAATVYVLRLALEAIAGLLLDKDPDRKDQYGRIKGILEETK